MFLLLKCIEPRGHITQTPAELGLIKGLRRSDFPVGFIHEKLALVKVAAAAVEAHDDRRQEFPPLA